MLDVALVAAVGDDDDDVVVDMQQQQQQVVAAATTSRSDGQDDDATRVGHNVGVSFRPRDLHHMLRFIPCTRVTISSLRTTCKSWRRVLECAPNIKFGSDGEVFHSRFGQCVIYNQRRATQERPLAVGSGCVASTVSDEKSFMLHSINPVGRKFRDHSARILARNFEQIGRGLTVLHLHHATITSACLELLGPITTLRELQLVNCRELRSLSETSRIASLELLEAELCNLDANALDGLFLPKLTRLIIKNCAKLEYANGIAPETAASLVAVTIEECPLVGDAGLCELMPNLIRIESLTLSCTAIENCVHELPSSASSHLRVLELSNTGVTTELLMAIGPLMTRVEVLRLDQCEQLLSLQCISNFQSLTALDVSAMDCSHYDAIGDLHSSLKALRVADSSFFENTVFVRLLVHLTMVDVSRSGVTDPDIVPFSSLQLLELIMLSGCGSVTNINPLSQCRSLKKIFANGTCTTDQGIQMLSRCPILEELDVSHTEVRSVNHLSCVASLKVVNVFGAVEDVCELADLLETGHIVVISDLVFHH